MRSISTKITIIYIFLALLNTIFFSIMIFDGQMSLLNENITYKAKEKAGEIFDSLNLNAGDINDNDLEEYAIIDEIKTVVGKILDKFIIFEENGNVLFTSSTQIVLEEDYRREANRAINSRDNLGQLYSLKVNAETKEINFYVPLSIYKNLDNSIMFFKIDLRDYNELKLDLWKMIGFIVGVIILFHIIFGIFLHRIIIIPIKTLHSQSNQISDGEYSARVTLKNKDEIGDLGQSFNKMAESIEDKITTLDSHNKKMHYELRVAGTVQQAIYPEVRETDIFNLAIYHEPLEEVSGDYHDVFKIANNKYGLLVCDVCGHGVPAALITMRIKELFSSCVKRFDDTKELFRFVNTELKDLMPKFDRYFTSFYLIIEDNKIIFTNAGHNEFFLIKKKTKKIYTLTTQGCVIGMTDAVNPMFQSKTGLIEPGDKIVMFSDGIPEAKNVDEELYDADNKFLKLIYKNMEFDCETMVKNIMEDVNKFIVNAEKSDDKTLMILEKK